MEVESKLESKLAQVRPTTKQHSYGIDEHYPRPLLAEISPATRLREQDMDGLVRLTLKPLILSVCRELSAKVGILERPKLW